MTEGRITNELLYEVLKSIQDRIGGVDLRLERIEDRVGHMEGLLGDVIKADLSRNADMTLLERRISRIERRLELNDTQS
ncbi:MAG: hypothetical protein AAFQ36_12240 [Pseudomonadota bacterium]